MGGHDAGLGEALTPYTPATSLLTPGRIGQAAWSAALTKHVRGFEANQISDAYHREAPKYGINPDLALAQAVVECAWFTDHLWTERSNPCGLGITERGVLGKDYGTPLNGILAHLQHLCCYTHTAAACPVVHDLSIADDRHKFHDGQPRLSHLQEPPPGRQWATGPGYVGKILAIANAILAASDAPGATEGATMPKIARICLAAGHANSDGGNPFERVTTGRLTPAIARACQALGMDVRVVQQGDPCQDFAGGIWDVARRVVEWHEQGWTPDIFLETHTQGVNNTAVRGVFGIWPDWGTDVDADAAGFLIPEAVKRISAATGIPIWSNGKMSERQTGVGLQGSRLGILNKTAPLAATTTRLLIEYGAHSNPTDAKIHRTDAFYTQAAQATAEAFAAFLGLPTRPVTVLTEPQHPPKVDGAEVNYYINKLGEPVVEINFGGTAKRIVGVNLADIGVSVIGTDDATYDRSLQAGAFKPYSRRQ